MDYKTNNKPIQKNHAPQSAPRGTRAAEVGAGSLGIVTKTSSPPQFETVTEYGEILKFDQRENGTLKLAVSPQEARAARWQLKSVVNRLLPESRTAKCHLLRAPASGGGLAGIEVRVTCEFNKAYYTGLLSCGSVWNCPVCTSKISERRRCELEEALNIAKDRGYMAFLVTLTNSHGIGDDLIDMKDKQQAATQKMSNGKNSIKNTLKRAGIIQHGFVRAYETTHGKNNGWHPHYHLIVFVTSEHSAFDTGRIMRESYFKRWHSACKSVGLPLPNEKHGVNVKDGSFAAKYAAKWGLAEEMSKTLHKRAKAKDGLSPWGLLRAIFDGDNKDYPREYAIGLFYVYSRAMSGARQLYWSNGLRDLLGMSKELHDEVIANQVTDELSQLLSTISFERWKQIRRSRSEARVLEIAETSPLLLPVYLTRFDEIQIDKDAADPLHLQLFYPQIDVRLALKGFLTKRQKIVQKPVVFLKTMAERLSMPKILLIPKHEKPA